MVEVRRMILASVVGLEVVVVLPYYVVGCRAVIAARSCCPSFSLLAGSIVVLVNNMRIDLTTTLAIRWLLSPAQRGGGGGGARC